MPCWTWSCPRFDMPVDHPGCHGGHPFGRPTAVSTYRSSWMEARAVRVLLEKVELRLTAVSLALPVQAASSTFR